MIFKLSFLILVNLINGAASANSPDGIIFGKQDCGVFIGDPKYFNMQSGRADFDFKKKMDLCLDNSVEYRKVTQVGVYPPTREIFAWTKVYGYNSKENVCLSCFDEFAAVETIEHPSDRNQMGKIHVSMNGNLLGAEKYSATSDKVLKPFFQDHPELDHTFNNHYQTSVKESDLLPNVVYQIELQEVGARTIQMSDLVWEQYLMNTPSCLGYLDKKSREEITQEAIRPVPYTDMQAPQITGTRIRDNVRVFGFASSEFYPEIDSENALQLVSDYRKTLRQRYSNEANNDYCNPDAVQNRIDGLFQREVSIKQSFSTLNPFNDEQEIHALEDHYQQLQREKMATIFYNPTLKIRRLQGQKKN